MDACSPCRPAHVYRFISGASADTPYRLWVVFSPRLGRQEPLEQRVTFSVAPAKTAVLFDLLGQQHDVTVDASGNVTLTAGASPLVLRTPS